MPLTYAAAAKLGKTGAYDWGTECDHKTGRLKMPSVYAPPCVPVPSGSNGGATSPGVSATSVNLVYYQAQPGGLASAISGAAGTPAQALATVQSFVAMFNHVYEMYGRHIDLIVFNATGAATDPVAAHADAVSVAQQDHAFASIGGPAQTPAYQDELAREHVFCMACGDSTTYGEIHQNAPYQWANLPTADTSLFETVGYVVAKLNGKDAIWAGDPAFHTRPRTFIVVSETSEPPAPGSAALTAALTKKLQAGRVRMAPTTDLQYTLDLTTLPTQAATIAEKLKTSGATSVIFAGDPIMPIYLTRACATIGYFPEWIITGIVLTDTSTLGRYYNQQEWAHAFGVTSLGVPVPVTTGRRRPSLPLVVRRHHLTGLPGGAGAHPAHPAVLRRRPAGRSRPHALHLHHRPVPRPAGRRRADVAAPRLRLPGRRAAAELLVAGRLHVPLVRRGGEGSRRGGPERQRPDALRQRRGALQGRRRPRRSRADVLRAGRRLELRVAARPRPVVPAVARLTHRVLGG